MNKNIIGITSILTFLFHLNAMAVYDPSWERPLFTSEMKVTHSEYGFKDVDQFSLTLTKRDGEKNYTGAIVKYKQEVTGENQETFLIDVTKLLKVDQIEKDSCGSTLIYAQLAPLNNQSPNPMGARYHLVLLDHSSRICKDYRPYLWEASIREGYGWCGTGDSTMEGVGNPLADITIQSIE